MRDGRFVRACFESRDVIASFDAVNEGGLQNKMLSELFQFLIHFVSFSFKAYECLTVESHSIFESTLQW